MTINDLIHSMAENTALIFGYFIAVPVLAFITGFIAGDKAKESPWKYIYTGIIYASLVPGIFAVMLCVYGVLFYPVNMLDVDILAYFLPLLSMILTMVFIKRRVSFDDIPGFERLSGLMIIIAVTFMVIFLLQRTFIGIFFFGTIWTLFGAFAVLFVIFKMAAWKLFKA